MTLRDYHWRHSYATSDLRTAGPVVDILRDFYIPALQRTTHYDRVAGYFRSSSLATASQGFSSFVRRGGRARFVVGMDVAPDDVAAILDGDRQRLEEHLLDELEPDSNWPDGQRHGVELLAWMVANGHLQIRVGLRVDQNDGAPRALDYAGDGYLHEKWALLGDGQDALFVSGSLNESRAAFAINAENITVDVSWDERCAPTFAQKCCNFEALWDGSHPAIRTFTLPEAVTQRLIELAPKKSQLFEIDGTRAWMPADVAHDRPETEPTLAERLPFIFLRLAPLLPGGEQVGVATAAVKPWPHQHFVAQRLLQTAPGNRLLCDEVGLGKTIEAGLVFRALWLSGRARSIRVFAPAALTHQWLREMAEKFHLPFVLRTNRIGDWQRVDLHSGEIVEGKGRLFDAPLEIISTGLLVNQRGGRILNEFPPTDVVLLDEAHKARRQSPDRRDVAPRFNRLYRELQEHLYPKARMLLLATATPMQLNRVEAFDLLRLMPATGVLQFSDDLCDLFYQLRERLLADQALAPHELEWLQRYLNDVRRTAPRQWDFVREHVLDTLGRMDLDGLVEQGIAPLDWRRIQPALGMLAPLARTMLRHTRELLRVYQKQGLLDANLAWRHVHAVVIPMTAAERKVYDMLQEYCGELARRIASSMDEGRQRAAIGFYLSFLRLRLASSFQALSCTMQRRLEKIERTLMHHAEQLLGGDLSRDDLDELEDAEIEFLVLKNRSDGDLTWEQGAVQELLTAMQQLPAISSKMARLLGDLEQRRQGAGRVRQTVLFTRFTDTLEALHKDLCLRLPDCPIGTFTGAGGSVRYPGSRAVERTSRTAIKQAFLRGNIDILLCSEAAAEGLNLQTADLLINFDLPWNPMLLEQRIGRIDRIGQRHANIDVFNYVYQGSAEEVVYGRLVERFQDAITVAGALQFSLLPIREEDFADFAKSPGEDGWIDELELQRRAEAHAVQIRERQRLTEFDAAQQKDTYEAIARDLPRAPVELADIWRAIRDNAYLAKRGGRVESFASGDAYLLPDMPGVMADSVLLTTSRTLFEHGLGATEPRRLHFATYGDPIFERLLSFMTGCDERIEQAWTQRQSLQHMALDGIACHSFAQAMAAPTESAATLELVPPTSVAPAAEADDRLGRLQKGVLNHVAARLAQDKLLAGPAATGVQMAELERFSNDVANRVPPRVHLHFDHDNRNAILAAAKNLMWRVEIQANGLRAIGDPLLLQVLQQLIRRELGELKRDRRTARAVANGLEQQARRVLSH